MAEAWRKNDEPLTTADLAGTGTRSGAETSKPAGVRDGSDSGAEGGPKLVRNEGDTGTEEAIAGNTSREEAVRPGDRNPDKSSIREMPGTAIQEMPGTAGSASLLSEAELADMRSRWSGIQAGFVDEPRRSVEQADQLVASAIQKLAEGFARERASLESQWESGNNVSTEDLRLALQRYRSFFGRLLNAA